MTNLTATVVLDAVASMQAMQRQRSPGVTPWVRSVDVARKLRIPTDQCLRLLHALTKSNKLTKRTGPGSRAYFTILP